MLTGRDLASLTARRIAFVPPRPPAGLPARQDRPDDLAQPVAHGVGL
jgi:hypothetical protein